MPDEPPLSSVVINDRFWLGYARSSTEATVAGQAAAAQQLATAVGWFWTAYTATAIAGLTFLANRPSVMRTIVLLSPSAVLIVAYLVATWAALPLATRYDPRVPDEIKASYLLVVRTQRQRLLHAKQLTALSAASVIVAGFATIGAAGAREPRLAATRAANGLSVHAVTASKAQVGIFAIDKTGKVLASQTITADTKGRADATLTGLAADTELTVRVTFVSDDLTTTIDRKVAAAVP